MDRKVEVQSGMEELRRMMESLQADVAILKKVVLQGCPSNADAGFESPSPKASVVTAMQRNSRIFFGI